MKTFAKYFLFVVVLIAISVGLTLFFNQGDEKVEEENDTVQPGDAKEFPEIGESQRDDVPLVSPESEDSTKKPDEQIDDLIAKIKYNYTFENTSDIRTRFSWKVRKSREIDEVIITGIGISAEASPEQIEDVKNFLKSKGFRISSANTVSEDNYFLESFENGQLACSVSETVSEEKNDFESEETETVRTRILCGVIE